MISEISVKIVADDPSFIPKRKTKGAACYDLVANIPPNHAGQKVATLNHRTCLVVDCGFSMQLPPNWQAKISARSGFAADGIIVTNGPGTIDEDYRGRIKVLIANIGQRNPYIIEHGTRIAQLEVMPTYSIKFEEVNQLDSSERGEGGLGSTGK